MSRERWSNWAGNLHCSCDVVAPRSLEELCDEVKRASGSGKRLRAAGGSYSWAPLVPSEDTIVRMHRLDRMLHFDERAKTVEVECGMTVDALNRIAAQRGMTLTSPTLFPKPTLGGAISTGAHGTDFHNGGMEDPIVEMKIVDAAGRLRSVSRGDPDLAAAKVALGTLGIVYAITLQLVPQYNVATQIRLLPVRRVLDEFEDLQRSCGFLELFWFPFQKNMWLYMMDRTTTPADPNTWWRRLKTDFTTTVENSASKLVPWIASHAPRLTPALNSVASRLAFDEGLSIRPAADAFHFQHSYPKCWDLEYAVPASAAARAWGDAVALVEHYADAALYPVNLAVHGRFTAPSSAWIAPNYGRPTCYLEVTSAKGTPHWKSFFGEMERKWCAIEGARPHWGKLYWQRDRIAAQYEMMNPFLDVRQRWDPERVFMNRFLEEDIFQLPKGSGKKAQPSESRAPVLGAAAPLA